MLVLAPKLWKRGLSGNLLSRGKTHCCPSSLLHLSSLCSSDEMNKNLILKFKRLSKNAFKPSRGSNAAAGFDIRSAYDYVIPAKGKELVKTDLQVHIPEGCYGRVAPRSGLAWKSFIDVGAGVIDADYRGNVCVILFNFGDEPFTVNAGDRIAQLICERIAYPDLEEVEDNLEETARGEKGFGSTGVTGSPAKKSETPAPGTPTKTAACGKSEFGSVGLNGTPIKAQ